MRPRGGSGSGSDRERAPATRDPVPDAPDAARARDASARARPHGIGARRAVDLPDQSLTPVRRNVARQPFARTNPTPTDAKVRRSVGRRRSMERRRPAVRGRSSGFEPERLLAIRAFPISSISGVVRIVASGCWRGSSQRRVRVGIVATNRDSPSFPSARSTPRSIAPGFRRPHEGRECTRAPRRDSKSACRARRAPLRGQAARAIERQASRTFRQGASPWA